ncbi:hypothetical protein OSTOST_13421 [Ostertagia ostertagi]
MIVGTGVGLIIKYTWDKRLIFSYRPASHAHDFMTFLLYAAMGVATTAIFWAVELAFWYTFHTTTDAICRRRYRPRHRLLGEVPPRQALRLRLPAVTRPCADPARHAPSLPARRCSPSDRHHRNRRGLVGRRVAGHRHTRQDRRVARRDARPSVGTGRRGGGVPDRRRGGLPDPRRDPGNGGRLRRLDRFRLLRQDGDGGDDEAAARNREAQAEAQQDLIGRDGSCSRDRMGLAPCM